MRLFPLLYLTMLALPCAAGSLYISQRNPLSGYGYGLANWDGTTDALQSAFGLPNITVGTGAIPDLASFTALWIQAPVPGDGGLTATEQSNVMAFLATGRRVVMVGENFSWLDWNNSILATVGGSYGAFLDGPHTLSPAVVHPVTFGILTVGSGDDGLASGGTSLFTENVVTLWGTQQNAISVLSLGMLDDSSDGSRDGNKQLKINLAEWLATETTAVPEPGTFVLIGLGLAATVWLRGLLGSTPSTRSCIGE